MIKAVAYARVSSKEQADEGYSIPAQTKLLRDYAASRGFSLEREFVDVETAKRSGRTSFREMVDYLRRHHRTCRVILVEKTDRLYRNFRDYVTLDDLRVEIHFVKEGCILSEDSRSADKLMHGIKVVMAKAYIDNLSEETSKGMLEKARQGTYPSYAPPGYVNCEVDGRRTLCPDPKTAPIIRRMFETYASGAVSLRSLREQAIADGLHGRHGGIPSPSFVAHTLRNEFYTGNFVWKGKHYTGDHEPLVSFELFQKAQEAFRKDNKPSRRPRRTFAYTGMITCAHCGCAVTAEVKKGRYVYYHCTGNNGPCGKPSIREELLEDLLGEVVRAIAIDRELVPWIKTALRESHKEEAAYHEERIANLRQEYDQLQQKIDRAYEDKLDGKISEEYWERRNSEWRSTQLDLLAAMESHQRANEFYFEEGCRILELASRAYELWLAQEQSERRKLLNIIQSNCIFDGTKLTACYKKPFCWLATEGSCSSWLPDVDSNHEHTG